MFFELSKFLNFFLISPISWIFLLLLSFCQQGFGGLCKVSNCKKIQRNSSRTGKEI